MEELGFERGLAWLQALLLSTTSHQLRRHPLLHYIGCFKTGFPFTGVWDVILEVGDAYCQWLEISFCCGTWVTPHIGLGCRHIGQSHVWASHLPQCISLVRMDQRVFTIPLNSKTPSLSGCLIASPSAVMGTGLQLQGPAYLGSLNVPALLMQEVL